MSDDISKILGVTRSKLLQLKADIAALQLRLLFKKYDPNQPRWPKGVHEGGDGVTRVAGNWPNWGESTIRRG
jgi:hypothetical protein